jgi:hypothetical protein
MADSDSDSEYFIFKPQCVKSIFSIFTEVKFSKRGRERGSGACKAATAVYNCILQNLNGRRRIVDSGER